MIFTLIAPLYLLPFLSASAQDSDNVDDSNWYQIEMIIFEHNPNFSGENWRKKVRLYYPGRLDFLADAHSETQPIAPNLKTSDGSESSLTNNTIGLNADTTNIQATLHTKLGEEQKVLLNEAKRLSRRRGMRLLFHEAWRQDLTNADDAKNILILGGNAFEDHYELEGSVSFSVSRYLHIATNLWFTKFEANKVDRFSRLEYTNTNNPEQNDNSFSSAENSLTNNYFNIQLSTGFWPQLPEVPSAFPENAGESEFNLSTSTGQPFLGDNAGLHNSNVGGGENTGSLAENSLYSDFPKQALGHRGITNTRHDDRKYRPAQIIEFKQKRRMRSDELHYIDHPRLGILVKIIPYHASDDEVLSETN